MDGDGQHNPLFLADVVRPVAEGRLDMCIGSRFITKMCIRDSPLGLPAVIFNERGPPLSNYPRSRRIQRDDI